MRVREYDECEKRYAVGRGGSNSDRMLLSAFIPLTPSWLRPRRDRRIRVHIGADRNNAEHPNEATSYTYKDAVDNPRRRVGGMQSKDGPCTLSLTSGSSLPPLFEPVLVNGTAWVGDPFMCLSSARAVGLDDEEI